MERTAAALVPRDGFSHFMAGQVVADLRWAMDGRWADKDVWAPIGPGSRRGMNVVSGLEFDKPMTPGEFTGRFLKLTDRLRKALPAEITSRMEAHDFQNCLCEISKYTKALTGAGRPKQLYRRNET